MSKQITVIETATVPEHLRTTGYVDSGLGAGILPKAPKLGITLDKCFTFTEGKTTTKMMTPEGKPVQSVQVVLLAAAQSISKAFYAGEYTPGSNDLPDCYSNDGRVPAPGVKSPKCTNCSSCPKNAIGSDKRGTGKACRDRKTVVLVMVNDPEQLVRLSVPTMSMTNLRALDDRLRKANVCQQGVVVELSFDYDYDYSVLKFNPVGYVDKETTLELVARSTSPEVTDLLAREFEVEGDDSASAAKEEPLIPMTTMNLKTGEVTPEAPAEAAVPRAGRKTKAQKEAERQAAVAAEEARKAQAAPPAAEDGEEEEEEEEDDAGEAPASTDSIADLIDNWIK